MNHFHNNQFGLPFAVQESSPQETFQWIQDDLDDEIYNTPIDKASDKASDKDIELEPNQLQFENHNSAIGSLKSNIIDNESTTPKTQDMHSKDVTPKIQDTHCQDCTTARPSPITPLYVYGVQLNRSNYDEQNTPINRPEMGIHASFPRASSWPTKKMGFKLQIQKILCRHFFNRWMRQKPSLNSGARPPAESTITDRIR